MTATYAQRGSSGVADLNFADSGAHGRKRESIRGCELSNSFFQGRRRSVGPPITAHGSSLINRLMNDGRSVFIRKQEEELVGPDTKY
jgi:hypothetical protein